MPQRTRSPSPSSTPPFNTRLRPQGYIGKGHETLGSDILGVLQILRSPAAVLGDEEAARLKLLKEDAWYPIEDLLRLLDKIDAEIGHFGLVSMGRKLFEMSHKERLLAPGGPRSARELLHGFDAIYRHANRGVGIGGWKVTRFEAGHAELEKTTPHHCVMEQGILRAALSTMGCSSIVTQSSCLRLGDPVCTFEISSSVVDARWLGV